jgi:hypothetical protein
MANKVHYTKKRIIEALRKTGGKVYAAARLLGCGHETVYRAIRNSKEVESILAQERGEMVDFAETNLKKAVLEGEAWAVCFTLKTLGKDRGYIERHAIEHGGPNGQPIAVEHSGTVQQVLVALDGREDFREFARSRVASGNPSLSGVNSVAGQVVDAAPPGPDRPNGNGLYLPKPNGNGNGKHPDYPGPTQARKE